MKRDDLTNRLQSLERQQENNRCADPAIDDEIAEVLYEIELLDQEEERAAEVREAIDEAYQADQMDYMEGCYE